eukprot:SAG22_NODE_378_length_11517_cov_26.335523_1_plen_351_part_00
MHYPGVPGLPMGLMTVASGRRPAAGVARAALTLLAIALAAAADSDDRDPAPATGGGPGSYRAAVVQFAPARVPSARTLSKLEARAMQMKNVDRMSGWMAKAAANRSQIVVFPESAIGSCPGPNTDAEGWTRDSILPFLEPIPVPTVPPTVLCDDPEAHATSPVTARLSCLARQHRIAAVFDLGDLQRCGAGGGLAPVAGGCREDGRAQFNTAVAFDADGGLLEKYHKHHLFKEQGWFDVDANLTRKGRFTPSFGVEFGLFICYDITFERAEPDAVTNFAFPTFWGLEGAAAEQQRWSKAHAVNLLAANIGGLGTSGFGIYSAGAALARYVDPMKRAVDKMLVADVPLRRP